MRAVSLDGRLLPSAIAELRIRVIIRWLWHNLMRTLARTRGTDASAVAPDRIPGRCRSRWRLTTSFGGSSGGGLLAQPHTTLTWFDIPGAEDLKGSRGFEHRPQS